MIDKPVKIMNCSSALKIHLHQMWCAAFSAAQHLMLTHSHCRCVATSLHIALHCGAMWHACLVIIISQLVSAASQWLSIRPWMFNVHV